MIKLSKEISNIIEQHKAYIVGGWLRDKISGRKNNDLDIITLVNPLSLARKIASKLGSRVVILDPVNKVYRVVLKDKIGIEYIDIAKFKGKDIISDLKKRDFTINSFALLYEEKFNISKIIDPNKGISDLKNKIIRATSQNSFKDDPLRLLRAFRFASELDFTIEPNTLKLIKKQAKLLSKSAPERIREEFFKILNNPDSSLWIIEMDKAGLLEIIIPEILAMKKSARNFYFHPNGLWQHAIETLMGLEEILSNLKLLFGNNATNIEKHLSQPLSYGVDRRSLLKFTALMHDVAKPSCAERVGKRMRFFGHEEKGSKMVNKILERLRLSRQELKIAGILVLHHMRPISLGQSPILTDRAIYRLFRDIGDNLVDLMLLTLSDCYSYRRLKTKKTVELKKQKLVVKKIVGKYFIGQKQTPKLRLIDGNDLINKLKLKPGPIIGKILTETAEAQALGKINTKDEAISYARRLLTRLKK
jgi:poly(A) polymerase